MLLLCPESSLTEKSKLNANGGVQANGAAAEDPGASLETNMVLAVEPTKQATVTLDEGRAEPKKASVMEVFKKVSPGRSR